MRYFGGAFEGWLGVIFLGAVALLPYMLRRSVISAGLGIRLPSDRPYLQRMWPHYWLAYAATGLSFMHACVVMGCGRMVRANVAGLYLATLGVVLLLLQVFMGLMLQQRVLPERKSIRRWHFWTMAGVVALVGVNVWLNG